MKAQLGAAMIVAAAALVPGQAAAQVSPRSPLLDLEKSELRPQIESRYQAAIEAAQATRRGEDSRYVWASEAKVQCGIALGYLKSGTRDEESINECDGFSARMALASAPAPVVAAVAPAPSCGVDPNVSVFFDWNADTLPAEAQTTVQQMVASRASCGWTRLSVTGHADRSGSDDYNVGISTRRANNVASMLQAAGIAAGDMVVTGRGESELKIETADGVREPMNRRVEISAQ